MPLQTFDRPEWIDAGGFRGEGFETYVPPEHGGPCAMGFNSPLMKSSFSAEGLGRS